MSPDDFSVKRCPVRNLSLEQHFALTWFFPEEIIAQMGYFYLKLCHVEGCDAHVQLRATMMGIARAY